MAEGIRIRDAALELSPEGLQSLLKGGGAELRLTRVDLSVSPDALNALLASAVPEGTPAPSAELADGEMRLTAEREGKRMKLDLRMSHLRLEISAEGLRLVSE